MYGYDPILLEKREVNSWINESSENILIVLKKNNSKISFTKSKSSKNSKKAKNNTNEKIFCLKKSFLNLPNINDIFLKCILINDQLMNHQTYSSKSKYFNIGYYINKPILIDIKDLKPSVLKNNIYKLNIVSDKDEFINKESLMLSQIGLARATTDKKIKGLPKEEQEKRKLEKKRLQQINKKNMPYKKEVYFENILEKALTDYSFQWDAPVNTYLRTGENYFTTDIFKQYYKRYGPTIDTAIVAIKNKIEDLDRAFLEAAPRNESEKSIYYRGMTQPFVGLTNIGDTITVQNYMSVSSTFTIALRFSGIPKGTKCCLYKIIADKGIPYIDMVTTTKYKHEKETLLPRNLQFELVNIEYINYPTHNPIYKIPIGVIKAKKNLSNQFKIKTGCRLFNVGKLEVYKDPSFIDKNYKKIKQPIAKDEKGNDINLDDVILEDLQQATDKVPMTGKRCPKGYKRNKTTGLCEINTSKQTTKQKRKTKEKKSNTGKLPRCPNGTRRSKVTGNCETYL